MKKTALFILLLAAISSAAQTKNDTIAQVRAFANWYDLEFTEPEADSMLAELRDMKNTYRAMHKTYPPNDLVYPFAFQPAPPGFNIPVKQAKINWNIPANVTLPANREDLAFYSIPQLASLIKNKKISSVELTKFFLNRLKKWGDTLECVITLTEELAMKEAQQADDEIRKGMYRGPLHGIPYGLKDLFAVKGYKTTWGSAPYKDQVIEQDAYVYTKLKNAGAVHCAKLSLGALAYDNRWFGGFTRNPWNLQQGSSG